MREVPGQKPLPAGGVLLQRILFDRPASLQPLYLRPAGGAATRPVVEAGVLCLPSRVPLSFDTYFNALFEQHWRGATRLRGLVLDFDARGDIALRVVRRLPEGGRVTLVERRFSGLDGPIAVVLPPSVFRTHRPDTRRAAALGRLAQRRHAGRAGRPRAGLLHLQPRG
jgi:hypothetical protein